MFSKKAGLTLTVIAACCILFAACASVSKTTDFSTVQAKNWQLTKVTAASGAATYDHSKLTDEYFKDIYTLQFVDGRAAGKASPNRYTGPYTLGENNSIAFKNFASTMMMGIKQAEGLSEHQFLQMLSKADKWTVKNSKLLFNSTDEKGAKVTMVFEEIK